MNMNNFNVQRLKVNKVCEELDKNGTGNVHPLCHGLILIRGHQLCSGLSACLYLILLKVPLRDLIRWELKTLQGVLHNLIHGVRLNKILKSIKKKCKRHGLVRI